MKILTVSTGECNSTDFREYDAVATYGLESCVAVAIYQPGNAAIAHLTNRFTEDDALFSTYREWLRSQHGSAALVGGWPNSSARLIREAKDLLHEQNIPITFEDLNVPLYQDIVLNKIGVLQVNYNQLLRRPGGIEFQIIRQHEHRFEE